MHALSRALAVLAVAAAVAAAPADITGVTPGSVAEGSVIAVTGAGFGRAPAAVLVNGATRIAVARAKKPKPNDTAFSGTVKKTPAGTYTLEVKPKGAKTAFSFPGVVVERPIVQQVSVASAAPGDLVTANVAFLGKSKGMVRVGCRLVKPTKWDVKAGAVSFVVPVGLPTGPENVSVVNGSGDEGPAKLGAISVTAIGGDGETAQGTFGTACFNADQVNTYGHDAAGVTTRLITLDARAATFTRTDSIFVQGEIPLATTVFPVTVATSVSYSVLDHGTFTQNYSTSGRGGLLTITNIADGFIEGTFTGPLNRQQATGSLGGSIPATGTFRAKIQ